MSAPFFIPFVGSEYASGFNNARTLILGAYHYCLTSCDFHSYCSNPNKIRQVDYLCPYHQNQTNRCYGKDCLHNMNLMEVYAYCNDEDEYPIYSNFVKYMLHHKGPLTMMEKQEFFSHVAFTNFLQFFSLSKIAPTFDQNKLLYLQALVNLKHTIVELNPQLIYVWGKQTDIVLSSNIIEIEGLKKESLTPEHPTMELSLYSYNYEIKTVTREYVRWYLSECFPQRTIHRTDEAKNNGVVPLDTAILNAIKRGNMVFDNGQLILTKTHSEQESKAILDTIRNYYTIDNWNEIDILVKKYDRFGNLVQDLRKLHSFSYRDKNSDVLRNDLMYNIFGIKRK